MVQTTTHQQSSDDNGRRSRNVQFFLLLVTKRWNGSKGDVQTDSNLKITTRGFPIVTPVSLTAHETVASRAMCRFVLQIYYHSSGM